MKRIKFVGLDVHAETIAVAVAELDGGTYATVFAGLRYHVVYRPVSTFGGGGAHMDSQFRANRIAYSIAVPAATSASCASDNSSPAGFIGSSR